MANPITREDENFFYANVGGEERPMAKRFLSPDTQAQYRAQIPVPPDAYRPAPGPMSVARPAPEFPLAPPVAEPPATAADFAMPAAPLGQPAAMPAVMPAAMQISEQAPSSQSTMRQTVIAPEAQRKLDEAQRLQEKAISEQQAAEEARAKVEELHAATVIGQVEGQIQATKEREQIKKQQIDAATGDLDTAINEYSKSKVDSGRWWANQSTAGKIGAALAAGVGAFASALTGQKNFALDIIQTAIDRDIADQKIELAKKGEKVDMKRNSLASLIQRLGSEDAAVAAMYELSWKASLAKLDQVMATAKSPSIKAKYTTLRADLASKAAEARAASTAIVAENVSRAGGQTVQTEVKPMLSGMKNELWTPFGPAPDREAAKEIRAKATEAESAMADIENYQKVVNELGTIRVWGTAEKGRLSGAMEQMKNVIRVQAGMGTLQESDSKRLDAMLGGIKTPGQVQAFVNEYKQSVNRGLNIYAKNRGVKVPSAEPTTYRVPSEQR